MASSRILTHLDNQQFSVDVTLLHACGQIWIIFGSDSGSENVHILKGTNDGSVWDIWAMIVPPTGK